MWNRSALALVIAAVVAPTSSSAQGFAAAWDGVNPFCITTPALQPVSAFASCVGRGGVQSVASASAVGGILQFSAMTSGDFTYTPPQFPDESCDIFCLAAIEDASARAVWMDALLFSGPVPAQVVFDLAVTGSWDAAALLPDNSYLYLYGSFGAGMVVAGTPVNGPGRDFSGPGSWAGTLVGSTDPIPIGGLTRLPFSFDLGGFAALSGVQEHDFVGHANVVSAAVITGIRFLDASGAPMTGVTYTLERGGRIGAVPEPTTWALVGTGVLAIGVLRRRRVATVGRR